MLYCIASITYVPPENFSTVLYKFATEDSNGMYYKRSNQINFDKIGKLIYAQIIIETSTERYQSQSKMKEAYDRWESIHSTFKQKAPAGLQNSFQTALFHWSFIKTEDALYNNAYIGISVSVVASFLVMLAGTLNVLSALYASVSIGAIITCVLAMFTLLDWEFGTMESIMSVVVLAFVARFVFLVSYSFLSTDFKSRYDRGGMALKLAGVSIVHSAISTVVSAFFIYACVVLLLDEFGTIVCFTILYSVLFSLLFLPSLLYIIGSSGSCGYIGGLFFCCTCPCAASIEGIENPVREQKKDAEVHKEEDRKSESEKSDDKKPAENNSESKSADDKRKDSGEKPESVSISVEGSEPKSESKVEKSSESDKPDKEVSRSNKSDEASVE